MSMFVRAIIRDSEQRIMTVFNVAANFGAGDWNFPGGKGEPGEAPEHAVVREVKEEVNLDITALEKVLETDVVFPGHYGGAPVHGYYFEAKADLANFKLNEPEKIPYMKFMTLEELAKIENPSMAVRAYLKEMT